MKKFRDLGRRAAALALAFGLALSTLPPALAAEADEAVALPALPQEEWAVEDIELRVKTHSGDCLFDKQLSRTEPTCTQAGSVTMQCSKKGKYTKFECTEKTTFSIPALDHDYGKWVETPASCATGAQKYRLCTRAGCGSVEHDTVFEAAPENRPIGHILDHKDAWEHPCTAGVRNWYCTRAGCTETADIPAPEALEPTAEHSFTAWELTKAPTCEAFGERTRSCEVCGTVETDTAEDEELRPLGHILDHKDEWKHPCTAGVRTWYCTREGCTETADIPAPEALEPTAEHSFTPWTVTKAPTCEAFGERTRSCEVCGMVETDTTEGEEIQPLGHDWGAYIDDDKPGCLPQTETKRCQREGCTAFHTQDIEGAAIRPHKFTVVSTELEEREKVETLFGHSVTIKYKVAVTKSVCDYGCGTTKKYENNVGETAKLEGVQYAAKELSDTVTGKVNDALKKTEETVRNAQTREEAIAALDTIYQETFNAIAGLKIGDVGITAEMAEEILKGFKSTLVDAQESLNDSFLSKETIQNTVTAVVSATTGNAGTAATKKNVYELLFTQAWGQIGGPKQETEPILGDIMLKLTDAAVAEDNDAAFNALTDTLVDDALELAIEELMKDRTYAFLIKTKLGAKTMDEVRAEIKKQLVEDTTFMDSVRAQVGTAAQRANEGVNRGWSNQKILNRLQKDLLPISDLVANKVNDLGESAGVIADKTVDDTVHKYLPGSLGDWVSDKVGDWVDGLVQDAVNDLRGQTVDIINTAIKQFTCGEHDWQEEDLRYATCTEKGQKGKVCRKCGKVTGKYDTDPLGHNWVPTPAVEPTQTSTGLTEGIHCSRCRAVQVPQSTIPMLEPTMNRWFDRPPIKAEDAKLAGFESVDAACAALDAALKAAGYDPAGAEHFTVQVNSSIGVLPNDRFPAAGATGWLALPEAVRGNTELTYYAVQLCTADNGDHKAGELLVTPVKYVSSFTQPGLEMTFYSEAITAIAWKAA